MAAETGSQVVRAGVADPDASQEKEQQSNPEILFGENTQPAHAGAAETDIEHGEDRGS